MSPEITMEELSSYHRIVVTGAPGTGKTTMVANYHRLFPDVPILHTDDLMGHPWASQPDLIKNWATGRKDYVIEGVAAARAIRYGLKPDLLVVVTGQDRTGSKNSNRAAMAKRVARWVDEIYKIPDRKFRIISP